MKVRVDRDLCVGYRMCEALAPDVYHVDEISGFNEMDEFEAAPQLRESVLRGIGACPERAIEVLED